MWSEFRDFSSVFDSDFTGDPSEWVGEYYSEVMLPWINSKDRWVVSDNNTTQVQEEDHFDDDLFVL